MFPMNPTINSRAHLPVTKNPLFTFHKPSQFRKFKPYKRKNLKLLVRNNQNPFDNLLNGLVSAIPSANSLELITPALGFASGVAWFTRNRRTKKLASKDIGEWVLFTSPTPFNRFVLLRCPSILFEGTDVSERLVKEDRHYVRLSSGRIKVVGDCGGEEREVEYQRVCVRAEDGGVVSLDWPVSLNLEEEHGFDTTVLLVPGSVEGSMDGKVREFVVDAVRRGLFPVVMNPRGCAGSPLTTPRLFTAADSDDVSTAVQYINKVRPWTTLMGVGWGYGANMLTKYLAEAGEQTPLTAATCIDNPFDLEEATRSTHYNIVVDQKLTNGLIDILRSNKELFQGRGRGFDVEKALVAKSVRDFEEAISMVSHGFDTIEDFYSKSSTQAMVGKVKIPVLFIQNDDGMVPLFSVPRSVIAENPFTSLLICSCLPSTVTTSGISALSWTQNLAIEWLTAVELGLLKGRHPLLKDVDVTVNPSNGLTLLEGRTSEEKEKFSEYLDLTRKNGLNGYAIDTLEDAIEEGDMTASYQISQGIPRKQNLEGKGLQEVPSVTSKQSSTVNDEVVQGEGGGSEDSERGQVLQTAQVIMNMLDFTMPGTLTAEDKKKVLTAVGQGETIMEALQDAVPEDVRGKLTSAVSGILHAQGSHLNFEGLRRIGKIPNLSPGFKPKIQEEAKVSEGESFNDDYSAPERIDNNLSNSSDNSQATVEKLSEEPKPELDPSEKLEKSVDLGQAQSSNNQEGDTSHSVRTGTEESESSQESDRFSREKGTSYSDHHQKGSETTPKPNFSRPSGKADSTEEATGDENRREQDLGVTQFNTNEYQNIQEKESKSTESSTDLNKSTSNSRIEAMPSSEGSSAVTGPSESESNHNQNTENKDVQPASDSSTDQNKASSSGKTEENSPSMGSSSEPEPTESANHDNQKTESKNMQPSDEQNKSNASDSTPPAFSVTQALDALTGIDDSTQLAVNSVFGAIESMITHLEEGNNNRNEVKEKSITEKNDPETSDHAIEDQKSEVEDDVEGGKRGQSDAEHDPPKSNHHEISSDSHNNSKSGWVEEPSQNPNSLDWNYTDGLPGNESSIKIGDDKDLKKEHFKGNKTDDLDGSSHANNGPVYKTAKQFADFPSTEDMGRSLLVKLSKTESLDLDTTTALFFDYFPEEGQWMLLERPGNGEDSICEVSAEQGVNGKAQTNPSFKTKDEPKLIIEPSYTILDAEIQQKPLGDYGMDSVSEDEGRSECSRELKLFVKNVVLEALNVEVARRLGLANANRMESSIARDVERVANTVSLTIEHDNGQNTMDAKDDGDECNLEKVGSLRAEHIIRAISSAVQDTSSLRRVLPVGVIVGSSLAALRKYFNVTTVRDTGEKELMNLGKVQENKEKSNQMPVKRSGEYSRAHKKSRLKNLNRDSVMVGAVTAAIGASALLAQHQGMYEVSPGAQSFPHSSKVKKDQHREANKFNEPGPEKDQSIIGTSLAEKAMSVAAPVVPTKEGGVLDQDRLVALLADLGQRGGILRLVGKVALLWGGIRGAMSLTDRLIAFFHIAKRPLHQRIIGFVGMVLVLWSPVVVPLLPTLVQGWSSNNPSKIAELVCIFGLYTAVMILIVLWGKRIRGYEDPLMQYGLDLTSKPKVLNFLKGLVGGVVLVAAIHSVNIFLGSASLCWPSSLSLPSLDVWTRLKFFGQMIMLSSQGLIVASAVALVEELVFRSWLLEEIAADIGYHPGVILSGLGFALFHRSLLAIPGLWLLSLGLAGARQRSHGSLSVPIGLRAGILASSFVLQKGGFLVYKHKFPIWVTGTHPFQPFNGLVGVAFSLLLAAYLYPRQPLHKKKWLRTIQN